MRAAQWQAAPVTTHNGCARVARASDHTPSRRPGSHVAQAATVLLERPTTVEEVPVDARAFLGALPPVEHVVLAPPARQTFRGQQRSDAATSLLQRSTRSRPCSAVRTRRRTHASHRQVDGPEAQQAAGAHALDEEQEVQCCRAIQEADQLLAQVASTNARAPTASAQRFAYQQARHRAAQAQRQLVQACKRYIHQQAWKLQGSTSGGRMGAGVAQSSLDDLFTAGVLGLTQAARRFDVAGGSLQGRGRTRFLTFAHHYIRKAMIEALRGADLDVYVPRHVTDIKARVAAALSDLNQEQSSTAATAAEGPEEEEGVSPQQLGVASAAAALQDPRALRAVSLRTGLRESHVADALSLLSTRRVALGGEAGGEEGDKGDAELSLAALWRVEPAGGQQGAGAARGQALAVPGVQDLSAVDERRKEALKEVLSGLLTARELQVLWLITGLAGGPAAAAGRPDSSSLEVMDRTAVGALLGVSRQAASQVIDRALGKLKAACAADARLVRELQELCAGHDEAN